MKNIRLKTDSEYLYPATKDENIIRKENNFIKKLYTGLLVNGDVNTSTSSVTSNSHRVVMRDNIVLPYMGVTLTFKLPENIKVKVYTSDDFMKMSGTNSDTNKVTYGWFKNGDTWTAKKEIDVSTGNKWQTGIKSEMQYRIMFCKFENNKESTKLLSVSEIQSLIDEDKILITYRDYSDSIITRNYANEANIRWAFTDRNTTGQPYTKRLPAIAHVSDLHGDYYRWKNCMEYCDYLGIKAVVVSGDILAQNTNDGYNWFIDVQREHPNITVLAVAGNHDHDGDTKYWNKEMLPTIAEVQNYVEYDQDSGNWYTYVESINTHFIGLDLYRGGSFKPSITVDDLVWTAEHIYNTNGNGFIAIVTHSSEINPSALIGDTQNWYSDMYTDDYMTQFSSYGSKAKLLDLLKHVICSKETGTVWVDGNAENEFDFGDAYYVNNNKLLGLFTGHLHRNALGKLYYNNGYEGELNKAILEFKSTIDNAISCNQRDSINGDGYGIVQDNFSIYGYTESFTRVARVGSVISTGGNVQDRVQISQGGVLSKYWENEPIIIDAYVADYTTGEGFEVTSENQSDLVNKIFKNPTAQIILRLKTDNGTIILDREQLSPYDEGEIDNLRFFDSTANVLYNLDLLGGATGIGYFSTDYHSDWLYRKPSDGIPSTDLSEEVQSSMTKANTAYQKPSGGIPATDLSTDLQSKVRQISPKEALFIDLWNDAAKPFDGKYNEQTGYYEMNGLTDITYEEALSIYNNRRDVGSFDNTVNATRTVIINNVNTSMEIDISNAFAANSKVLVVDFKRNLLKGSAIFYKALNIETIKGMIVYGSVPAVSFRECKKLSTLNVSLQQNQTINVQDSPLLSYDSINYIITHSYNTAAITITVHPNTYAYLQGTAAPIADVGGTTEQWQALLTAATAKQISFAEGTPTT